MQPKPRCFEQHAISFALHGPRLKCAFKWTPILSLCTLSGYLISAEREFCFCLPSDYEPLLARYREWRFSACTGESQQNSRIARVRRPSLEPPPRHFEPAPQKAARRCENSWPTSKPRAPLPQDPSVSNVGEVKETFVRSDNVTGHASRRSHGRSHGSHGFRSKRLFLGSGITRSYSAAAR